MSTPAQQPQNNAMNPTVVGFDDVAHMARLLGPGTASRKDVLFAVCSTPSCMKWGAQGFGNVQKLRNERWALVQQATQNGKKDKSAVQLPKTSLPLEGIDKDVLGRKWVQTTLAQAKAWPPPEPNNLQGLEFELQGKAVKPLDHPALARNLCMIMGRLHARMLNSHNDLVSASALGLIDQTYFMGSQRYRTRVQTMLDAALRTAMELKAFELSSLVIETMSMFKNGCDLDVGVDHENVPLQEWYDGMIRRTYDDVPRLKIENAQIAMADKPQICVGDDSMLSFDMTRLHADNFAKKEYEYMRKQGKNPATAKMEYRETWWCLVKTERLDLEDGVIEDPRAYLPIDNQGSILKMATVHDIAKFATALPLKDRLVTAWPLSIQNPAHKSGKVKMNFPMPPTPGTYRFSVRIKSMDYIGADPADVSVDVNIAAKGE